MDALTMQHMSAMPAPTWRWLRMNDTAIEIPQGLERVGGTEIEAEDALLDTTATFEGAVAELQERLDAARGGRGEKSGTADSRASVRAAKLAAEDIADLDTPALSRYQRRAALEEDAGDVAAAFETGIGADARAYLGFIAGGAITLATEAGAEGQATVRITGEQGGAAAASVDVVAAAGSTFDLAISLDGVGEDEPRADSSTTATPASTNTAPAEGADSPASEPLGLIGSELRVFAGANARVNVTVYITASDAFTALDDSGYVLDEGARVTVRHVVLGGAHTVTGLAADLRGDSARMDIDTRYLASAAETRDFNYVIRQRGRKTVSNMDANGVLTGRAKKVLRGTIDLVHGCKGSEGTERETVLIASKGVDNKTVPVILCDEDDVAGNHGATIGHVRPEQLFYLGCRGLSEEGRRGALHHRKARGRRTFRAGRCDEALCDALGQRSGGRFRVFRRRRPRGGRRMTNMETGAGSAAATAAAADIRQNPYKADFPLLATKPEIAFLDSGATAQRPACVLDAQRRFYKTMNANPLRGLYSLFRGSHRGNRRRARAGRTAAGRGRRARTRAGVRHHLHPERERVAQPRSEVVRAVRARAGRRGRHHHHGAPFEPHPLAAGVPGGGRDARLPLSGRRGPHHARGDRRQGGTAHENRRLRARVERARRGESRLCALADAVHAHGGYLVVDGAQSVPHMAVDVRELHADFFAFSAHKALGPMGIGVLWGRHETARADAAHAYRRRDDRFCDRARRRVGARAREVRGRYAGRRGYLCDGCSTRIPHRDGGLRSGCLA